MIDIPRNSFYFIRHGETDWNLQNKFMGKQDIPLNETGIDQAYEESYVLDNIELDKVFSSPLKRAKETAIIISDECRLELEIVDKLQERSWGSLEGRTRDSVDLSFLSDKNIASDSETYLAFETRIISAMKYILTSQMQYPLIISHGGVFMLLAHLLIGKRDTPPCPNCKTFIFTPSSIDKSWEITPLEHKFGNL
jgi:uncharacterized phosphatase